MGLLDRVNKRKKYPVKLDDREIFVRALKNSEFVKMGTLETEFKNAYFIGKGLVKDDETPEVPQNKDESDQDFAKRVEGMLDEMEVDSPTVLRLIHEISTVTKFDPEEMAKNSG